MEPMLQNQKCTRMYFNGVHPWDKKSGIRTGQSSWKIPRMADDLALSVSQQITFPFTASSRPCFINLTPHDHPLHPPSTVLMKCFETDAAGSTSTTTESDTPQHCNEGRGVGIIATASTEGNERHGVGIITTTSTEDTAVWQPTSSTQRIARRAIPDF